MLSIKQARDLSGQRKICAQTRSFEKSDEEILTLRFAQVGLPFISEHAAYLTVFLKSPDALGLPDLRKHVCDLQQKANKDNYAWVVVSGVSFDQWAHWCEKENMDLDPELFADIGELRELIVNNEPPYKLTGGELFFHIKAQKHDQSVRVAEQIMRELDSAIDSERTEYTIGDSMHGGRIYGGRMLHGLIGSVDPVGYSARVIIGDEHPMHKGGCYGLTMRFVHDWGQLLGMADSALENLIGRNHVGNVILRDDKYVHIKAVRVNDENGLNYRLANESQPFRSETSLPGKEDGVYQVSFAKNIQALTRALQGMISDKPGYVKSRHLKFSHADMGSYWYIPSATELGLDAPHSSLTVPMNEFFDIRSKNGTMFYNTKDFLHQLGNRTDKTVCLDPLPTDRITELLGYCFGRWHDTWYKRRPAPELGHLEDYLEGDEAAVMELSVAERKGYAVRKTLDLLSWEERGRAFGLLRLHPKELIVGVVPEFTLGSGFEAMRYLLPAEQDDAFVKSLNEAGAAGHNVPNYKRLLDLGIGGLIDNIKVRLANAADEKARAFYQSAVYAFEGVQIYLRNYAALARQTLEGMKQGSAADKENLEAIASRLEKLAEQPPETFLDAAQLVFSMHCCMHISGESVSIGRLDQLLDPFLQKGDITPEAAQEIIDCFWIKMDEQVLLNHRHFNDRFSRGAGAITYEGGDFPQGAALNQWVQQVTVGGFKANDAEPGEDACNDVTRMCLRAMRRLPLNAPCLSLRVHKNTPEDILEEAARVVLSGGGHPFMINDDKLMTGLLRSGEVNLEGSSIVALEDAREMVCDGCFEAVLAGKSEFAFSYVPVPSAIEMALNRGRTYAMAGPVHITGLKASFRSKKPEEVESWDEFYAIFLKHYRYQLVNFYTGMLSRYGNLNAVCPSPLLSPLIDGCLERGRDMTEGGAKYKILAPLMNGIIPAIDALWAIKDMVYGDEAVFTLPELTRCLICDWGHDMKEPFYSKSIGEDRIATEAKRFQNLRAYALTRAKFGTGHAGINAFGRDIMRDLVHMAYDVIRNPVGPVAENLKRLKKTYGTEEHPFDFVITPGVATFEDYAGIGSFLGASAEGRRAFQTVSSDCSASTTPPDLPIPARGRDAVQVLRSWAPDPVAEGDPVHVDPFGVGISNGSPTDINIRENFPVNQLVGLLKGFASGELGPNMMSISCADPQTLLAAQKTPERYDLVRMRMGGWSEFFVAMFPHHQEQHKRRPIFEACNG